MFSLIKGLQVKLPSILEGMGIRFQSITTLSWITTWKSSYFQLFFQHSLSSSSSHKKNKKLFIVVLSTVSLQAVIHSQLNSVYKMCPRWWELIHSSAEQGGHLEAQCPDVHGTFWCSPPVPEPELWAVVPLMCSSFWMSCVCSIAQMWFLFSVTHLLSPTTHFWQQKCCKWIGVKDSHLGLEGRLVKWHSNVHEDKMEMF